MKKLTVLFLGLLAAATLSAAPFARWFDFPGAGGKTYRIYGEGDEFTAWFEAEDGHAVGFNDAAKAYEYLKPQADGSLIGTGILVGDEAGHEAELAAIPLHARDTSKAHEEEVRARIEEADVVLQKTERWNLLKGVTKTTTGGKIPLTSAPSFETKGNFTGCMLLVEFSDVKWPSTITKANMDTYANDENGAKLWNNTSSIWQFYHDVSCGKVSYKNVVIGPVTVPHPRSYYDDTSRDSGQCARSLISDALDVLSKSASSVREGLSSVTKRDGRCIVLNVFFAGNEASVWSKGLWACQWTLASPISVDGVPFYTFQISPITSSPISYHFAHENGHALCGFPDLYNAGGAHNHCLMGNTCLMAGRPNDRDPQAPSAYLRAAAGWVTPKTLPNNTYVTLTRDYGDVYKYKNPNNENEYYLIENRGQRHDQDKTRHDGSISGSGIVIYHCMANGNNKSIDWNTAFSAETSNVKYRCKCEATLEQADGQYHHERNQWIADANDFWSAGNTAADYPGEFSDLTVPTARWADGTPSGLVLSEFSANGDTMTFAVGTPVIEGAPTISGTITAGGYVGTGKLTISNFGTGASSADVFVDIYGEATKKTLVGSVNLATGVTSTSQKTYTFPLVNGLASQYLRFRVVNNQGKAAYGTLTEAANGKAGDSSGGWGTDGGNEFGKAVDAPSLTINYTQNGAEWQKDTSATDYLTASSCLKFYGASSTSSAKTATLTATVAGPGTFTFYASSKLSMNGDMKDKTLGNPQCSVVFTAKNSSGQQISTKTIPCSSTTKTAYQAYSVNLPAGNNTLTWVGSWIDPVNKTYNVGNVYIDKFLLEKNVAATIPVAKITTSSLLPDRATIGAQVTDMADESSVNVTSIVVSPNSDYSSPVHTGNPGLVTGLEPLTRYYVKATLMGASGTTYPAIGSFVTPDWTKPTGSVTVSSVQHYSATVDVSVTNPGSETAANIVKAVTVARDAAYIEVIKSGASVPCDLTGLDAGTTYYVRGILTGPLTGDTYVESTFTTLSASYPLIGSVKSADVGTDRISVNVTVAGFGDGSSGGTVLVEAVSGDTVAASANGTASGVYELTGLDRDTEYTIRVTVTGSNGLSTTDESLVVKTLNVPVILADPTASVGAEGASATMSARVAFRESTVNDSNVKLYLTQAGGSETLAKTWNSYAQGDVLSFSADTEPNVDYTYRFVATTTWNSKNWTSEAAGEFRTEYYVTNDWLTVDFESYQVNSALPDSDASGSWTKNVGGVYESSSTVVNFASEFGKGKGLDQSGESTYAKYTATATRPDGIRCLFDADMYFTVCKVPPESLTDQVLATATTAIFLYSGDEANNFRVYTADGWIDVFAEGFEPANKTFHHVTIDVDYDASPARVRFTVDGHLLADANGVKWFNRANSSSTAKLTAVSVYGNTKLDGFSAKMLEYANDVCAHANKTETSAAVAATCTVAGHTAAYRCPDCGRVWEAETIPALGHDWGEWMTKKAATTTETGISRRECQRSGCNAYEEQEIPKLANVVALRNVAVVTAVGTAPELPETVAGLRPDGIVDGEYDVVWNSASAPSAVGITTVTGTAQVNGAAMTVTASVRAANASGGPSVNLSSSASTAVITAASGVYKDAEALLKSDTPLADNQWGDYLVNISNQTSPNTTELTLGWDSSVTVSEVAIYFVNNASNYQPPANVKFYDESGAAPTEIAFTAGAVVDSGAAYAHIVYTFSSPKTLSKIRFYATPDPATNARALFTRRMWVYGPDASAGGSVDPTTTDTLTALAVDGTPIAGFAPTTYSYSVDNGTAISSAVNTDDNVGITILQKYEGSAYVVTLAENGTATKKYTVAMPTVTVCAHEHTTLTGAIAATCTTAGYTGDTVCDDCHETIQTGSVITALGHLWSDWVTTKDPTTTEAGSKKRECQREGCDAEEVEEIPMLEGVTLTLDPKGGTVASTTVDLPAVSLPTPVRDGYHFVGWFKDEIDADTKEGYVRGRYLCGEPLTSATADDKDKILYAKWVKNDVYSHFQGKKAVFVGDSLSTLHGYAAVNRQVYTSNIFYTESKAAEQGITATNTWWGQLVQALDMSLLSVNAVAGSPVTDSEPSITYDVRAMSSTARIDDLDVNGTPDVIFIFGGINDFNGNTKAPIDDYDQNASYLTDELDLTSDYFPTFAEGYATMLRRMRHYYPDAEIVAIGPYIAASDRDAYKPVFVKGNTTISNLCARFNVPYLNLMNTQLPYWANGVKLLCDSYHPNQAGFTEFANYVLENFVPACTHEHKTALTGVVTATCTTDGYSGDCTCEDCGETILGHVITKLGHDWGEWVTKKEASETETGLKRRECQRSGCNAYEEQEIPMIVEIAALRNIAVVTAVGTAPTLPEKVAGLKADGTVSGEYEVSWSPASVPDSPGITMVSGTATVNGAPMSVTASVRAAVAGGNLANVSPSSTLTSTDPQGAYLSEVVSADEPDPSGFKWMTVLRTNASDMTNTLTWDAPKTISKVRIAYSGHMNHSRPATVDFNTGAANIPMQETARETVGAHLWVEYTFSQPTAVTTLLCHFTRGSEVNSILVERIWAYEVQSGGSVEPTTTDTLTALAVDGNAVAGFAATTYGYTVTNGKTVSSAVNADDNVGITILQKSVTGSDNAYVVTLAENGTATQKYTVAMPAGEEPPPVTGASVTLNANGGTVASTTVELPAESLPTPTRDGYHFVGWFEDKTLTSYDFTPGGTYVPGTFLYGTPVTAPTEAFDGKTLYAKWVKASVYEHFHGKKVAVYGDSVSTLLGFVPSAESEMFNGGVFYGQSYVDKGINEHTQWWGQLVDALGMQLLEINAIGGSSVGAYAYEYGLERKAMMNYTRMRLLDDAGTPDVIIVAAGINDYNDSTTGFNANADYLTGDLDRVTSICPDFAKAYALMIRRLQDLYPTTEIVALSSFDVGAATATEIGNDCIRRTCALYNVVNIDMRNAFTLNDGTGVDYRPHGIHPGISGFAAIANCFLENYVPIANPVVVPDCGHTWGFGVLTTPATATASGVRTYTCRHCSATRTEEVPYVALSEGTEADITSQATVKGVYLLPDDRQVAANTVDKQATPLASYNGYLEPPANLIDSNADTIYKDWIMNDRYIAFTFDQPMVVTSVKLYGVMNRYPNKIQIVDLDNRLLGKTDGGIPYTSGQHQCTITTTERVATSELRLAVDFEYVGKEFQLKEVEIFGYAAGTEPPIDPPDDPVETEIVALRNIAAVTAVGTAPTLPTKVAGLKADGTVDGEYDVVWETSAAPDSEGITTVAGTAQVNGAAMSVTASVRAANASSGDAELVNVSPSATPTSNDPSAKTHSVPSLVSADSPGDSVVWVTANNGSNLDLINTLTWDSPVTISKVRVCYSGSHKPPSSYAFSSDSSGTPEITFTAGQVETVGNHRWIEFTFGQPTTLSTLRCFFGNPPGWLIVERIWAYEVKGSAGGTIDPLTTDTLSALSVDGNAVAGFAPTTYSYTVENGTAITSATSTDNVGITILPKYEGSAYVVTFAEDGESTQKYTVAMPAAVPQATVKIVDRSGKETTVTKPLDEIVDAINSAVATASFGSKVILPALDTDYTVTLAPGVRVVKNADSKGTVSLVIPSAKSGWYVLNEAGDAMKLSEGAKPFVTDIQVADGASVVTIGNVKVNLYYAVIKSETLFGFETASVVATSDKIASGETFVFELPHGENEPQAFYKVLVTDDPAKADDPRGGGGGEEGGDDDPVTVDITQYTWCSLGTSITDFNDDPTTGRTKGYQFFLMDELKWDRAKLVNEGHSGTLVSSAASKPPATPCDIYTVEYGVNDWGTGHPVGTLSDYKNYLYNGKTVRWNNFASCYRNLIEMIKAVNPNAVIVLITPRKAYGSSSDAGTKMFPANCDDPTLSESVGDYYDPAQGANVHGDQTYLKDYADLIKAIGEYEGFPVVDWYSSAATQANLASLSVDNAVHPNDAGYEVMADLLKPVLLKAVQDKAGGGGGGGGEGEGGEEVIDRTGFGPWNIQVLDPYRLVMQFDGAYSPEKNYVESGVFSTASLTTDYNAIKSASFTVNGAVTAQAGHAIAARGQMSYTNAQGQAEIVGGTNNQNWELRAVHNLYLTLASPLVEGENTVLTPDNRTLKFNYGEGTVSPLFKVNQVGYAASAAEKYIYLGGWMGTAGAFPLGDSYTYKIYDAASGSVALTGSFTKRMNDTAQNSVAMSGEKTLEADISALTTPGTYYVRVDGIGRSMNFRVSDDAAADQFAVHMLGLYQQRCGCAKEEPYTHWTDTCCHQKVYRGVHPSNDDEYKKCFGGTAQSAFAIINANADDCKEELTLPGGWHDAADYDRRPYHLQVVVDLANAYLMKPANFTDGQLAVPEKNNGIPDILDEADWGLKFYLAAQQDDGGVGGWAETVTHPDYSNKKMPSGDTEKFNYYLGRATHRSTLKYCGTAANLARALYAVGTSQATARADVYKASAVAAWNYVMRTDNWQSNVEMKGPNGKVYYTEPRWYDPYEYTKAAVNLGVVTGNHDYFNHLSDTISYRSGGKDEYNYGDKNNTVYGIFEDGWGCATKDESYGRTGFILSELGLSCAADNIDAYNRIKDKWVARVTANAEDIINSMASAMAYRTAAPYGVSKMAWGACVPLRNAEWLCAAHFFTGDAKYLKAAQLASDYHSGCNPCGATWTSGLGKIYPVAFLSLHSFADSIAEYVPGITPYHNTGADFGYLFNNVTKNRYTTYQSETGAKPWWRRFEVGENMSIGISEYTVTETIGPCAAASGYLINAGHTTANLNWRQPAAKLSDLPGYWALP